MDKWLTFAYVALGLLVAGFERWLNRAYPEPNITVTIGEDHFEARNVDDLLKIVAAGLTLKEGTANEDPNAIDDPPEAN